MRVLNRPVSPEDIPPAQEDLNIDTGAIRLEDVATALKRLKNYKAPAEDGLFPEMFKVEEDALVFFSEKIIPRDIGDRDRTFMVEGWSNS